MKRHTAIALFTFLTVTGVPSAWAQDRAVRKIAPFSFVVGGKLPEVESSTAPIHARVPPCQMKETHALSTQPGRQHDHPCSAQRKSEPGP